mgnify:FL=1
MRCRLIVFFLVFLTTVQAQYFRWAKSMGSNNVDVSRVVAVDGSGNVYTVGYFQNSADFDPGLGAFNLTSQGGKIGRAHV